MMSKLVPKLRFKEFCKCGFPGGHSVEWEEKKLNKIIDDFIVPMRDKPKDLTGNIPWCRIEDFEGMYLSRSKTNQGVTKETVKNMNLKIYPKNTLLVSCSADLGRCAIVKNELITNQTFIGLKPKKNEDVRFLYYLMSYSKDKLNVLSTGTTISYLSRQEFENFKVFIPTPKEQQKIANTLSSLDSLIEATSKKVEALKKHKKGLMQKLFPKEDKKEPELRFKEFSGEWEEKKLGDIVDIYNGSTPKTSKQEYWNGEINWITPAEMGQHKYISSSIRKITKKGLENSNTKLLPINSVILSCRAPIGYVAINKKEMSFNQGCKGIIPNKINHEFLYYFLKKQKVELENLGSGNTFKEISTNNLKSLKTVIPTPEEQQKISDTLSSLDSLIESTSQKIEALKKHKKSLMQQMFVSGEG